MSAYARNAWFCIPASSSAISRVASRTFVFARCRKPARARTLLLWFVTKASPSWLALSSDQRADWLLSYYIRVLAGLGFFGVYDIPEPDYIIDAEARRDGRGVGKSVVELLLVAGVGGCPHSLSPAARASSTSCIEWRRLSLFVSFFFITVSGVRNGFGGWVWGAASRFVCSTELVVGPASVATGCLAVLIGPGAMPSVPWCVSKWP